jgi:hypothetical protein
VLTYSIGALRIEHSIAFSSLLLLELGLSSSRDLARVELDGGLVSDSRPGWVVEQTWHWDYPTLMPALTNIIIPLLFIETQSSCCCDTP